MKNIDPPFDVQVPHQPAVADVAHDPLDALEGVVDVGRNARARNTPVAIMITSTMPASEPKFHQ